jgi:hypothetical protein
VKCARAIVAICLAGCLWGCFNKPEFLIRQHAYDGPIRSKAQIATIFAEVDDGWPTICRLDGNSLMRFGTITDCPSVLYVLPGKHTIEVKYQEEINNRGYIAWSGDMPINVAAGAIYRIRTAVNMSDRKVRFRVEEMPSDFILTYKDVGPMLFRTNRDLQNSAVDPERP